MQGRIWTVPNQITLLRLGFLPFFLILISYEQYRWALLVLVVAGLSDGIDGLLARKLNQKSALGAYLDPIADKLLLTSAYVMLSIPALNRGTPIPVWVTVLVIARDVLLVVVALVLYLAVGVKKFPPSALSKVTTVCQVAAIVLVLLSGLYASLEPVALGAMYLVGALTLASGLDYIVHVNRLVGEKGR
jgi:cardiolipin synthase